MPIGRKMLKFEGNSGSVNDVSSSGRASFTHIAAIAASFRGLDDGSLLFNNVNTSGVYGYPPKNKHVITIGDITLETGSTTCFTPQSTNDILYFNFTHEFSEIYYANLAVWLPNQADFVQDTKYTSGTYSGMYYQDSPGLERGFFITNINKSNKRIYFYSDGNGNSGGKASTFAINYFIIGK